MRTRCKNPPLLTAHCRVSSPELSIPKKSVNFILRKLITILGLTVQVSCLVLRSISSVIYTCCNLILHFHVCIVRRAFSVAHNGVPTDDTVEAVYKVSSVFCRRVTRRLIKFILSLYFCYCCLHRDTEEKSNVKRCGSLKYR